MRVPWPAVGLVFATLLPGTLPALRAAGEPDGFFRYTVAEAPVRSAFPELSDTEFASIRPAVRFYPFILDGWRKGPLLRKTYFGLPTPWYSPDDGVESQATLLRTLRDPGARSVVIARLGEHANPRGIRILTAELARERDTHVQADLLKSLRRLGARMSSVELLRYATREAPHLRYQALATYAAQPAVTAADIFAVAGSQEDARMRLPLWSQLGRRRLPSTVADWLPYWTDKCDVDVAGSLAAPAPFPDLGAHREQVLELSRRGHVAVRRSIAAHLDVEATGAALADALMATAATDANASVRAAAAASIGRCERRAWLPHLLRLAADTEPEVRRTAATALGRFPTPAAFAMLVQLSGDRRSMLVREQAYDTLVGLHGAFPVAREIGVGIDHGNVEIRYNSFRLLAALGSGVHNARVLAALPRQRRPLNVAAAILALAAGACGEAETAVLTLADAEDAGVRAAVATYIGALRIAAGYDILRRDSLEDQNRDVRLASTRAMGVIADGDFSDALLKIIKRTNYARIKPAEFLNEQDRAYACWALAQLPGMTEAVRKRLREQIRDPVIHTMLGPAYESDYVRTSACWTLVHQARKTGNAGVASTAKAMVQFLRVDPLADDAGRRLGGMTPPSSVALRYYASQAERFMTGKPLPRTPVPLSRLTFGFRRIRRPKTR